MDEKVPQLASAALPLQATDVFYVVQLSTSPTDRKITFVDLSGQISPPPTPHDLLDGNIDQDTVAHTVVLGDTIAGNSTPKWQAIAGTTSTQNQFYRQVGNGAVSALPSWQRVQAADVDAPVIGSPTYKNLADRGNIIGTAGAATENTNYISDAGGGNIDVAAGTGYIRTSNSNVGDLKFFNWAALLGQAIPSGTVRYVGVTYNAGSPQVEIHTSEDWTYHDSFPLGSVVNDGTKLHISNDGRQVADSLGHNIRRWYQTHPLDRDERVGGLAIGNTGTRNFSLTTGIIWDRTNEFTIAALDTSISGSFTRIYRAATPGTYTSENTQTQWPNTQYDDGTGTLHTMTANRWANVWWYVETDGDVVMMYGRNQYTTQAAAALESPPSSIPLRLQVAGKLLGRFVFQNGASSPAQIDSVFTTTFQPTAASDHAALSDLGWTTSGHTGTPYAIAEFNTTGNAAELVPISGGDMIVANSTPAWAKVAKGAGSQVWAMDAGATEPAWRDPSGVVTAASNWHALFSLMGA